MPLQLFVPAQDFLEHQFRVAVRIGRPLGRFLGYFGILSGWPNVAHVDENTIFATPSLSIASARFIPPTTLFLK